MTKNVVVIGAAGRVGLPFTLSVVCNSSENKYKVIGIDLDENKCQQLMKGEFPFIEEYGKTYLDSALKQGVLFTSDTSSLKNADIICVMVGTPIDEENNPKLNHLFDVFEKQIIPILKDGRERIIILRSTVAPGTTRLLHNKLLTTGAKFKIFFCPERVSQGHGIEESTTLPTLIGCEFGEHTEDSKLLGVDLIDEFFRNITRNKKRIYLSWEEAEIGKLITNMARYVNFAFVNQCYEIADSFGEKIDINKVIDACNYNYPRLNLPKPGFAAGPCLAKDGMFLTTNSLYSDLINTSFLINENFVNFIANKAIKKYKLDPMKNKIGILGTAFKAENDDTRKSLSFKMIKTLKLKGFEVLIHDPFWADKNNVEFLKLMSECDTVIIMTNHSQFKEQLSDWVIKNSKSERKEKRLIDIWKLYNKKSSDGFDTI